MQHSPPRTCSCINKTTRRIQNFVSITIKVLAILRIAIVIFTGLTLNQSSVLLVVHSAAGSSPYYLSSTTTVVEKNIDSNSNNNNNNRMKSKTDMDEKPISIVFSDLDGTLIHYPKNPDDIVRGNDGRGILLLPPSATGMRGVVSSKTLLLCSQIRSSTATTKGTKLVLISGMRSSTLIKRLPYLPKADAYVCEAGGRIFYPVTTTITDADVTANNMNNKNNNNNIRIVIRPVAYDGATEYDLQPFSLVEDEVWRRQMERQTAAGPDGYIGNEAIFDETKNQQTHADDDDPRMDDEGVIPLHDRVGILWEYARQLQKDGLVLDIDGYATCFRINRKHQKDKNTQLLPEQQFVESITASSTINELPTELSTSTNLGCIDYYPIASGKKNCCEYLAKKFIMKETTNNVDNTVLAEQCVCLCDDDNDIEMALACKHAYIPYISSDTMAKTIQSYPTKFTTITNTQPPPNDDNDNGNNTSDDDHTVSTEAALQLVLARIQKSVRPI